MKYNKTIFSVIAIFCLLATAAFAAAKVPAIAKLLPEKEVSGWQPFEDSLTYGKGDAMTEIYNGACPEYQKQGIVEAVQQIYQTADSQFIMEVILNKAKTEKRAKAFFEKQRKALGGGNPVKIGKGQMFLVSKKPVQGYIQVKGYVSSVVPTYDDNRASNDCRAFLKAIGNKLDKAKK